MPRLTRTLNLLLTLSLFLASCLSLQTTAPKTSSTPYSTPTLRVEFELLLPTTAPPNRPIGIVAT
jgi:hypothetical protein